MAIDGDDGESLVAIDHVPFLVDRHHPIGVAVEGDAHVGAPRQHLAGQRLGVGRAVTVVDVGAVGLRPDDLDPRAGRRQSPRGQLVAGSVGAVDDDRQAGERDITAGDQMGEITLGTVDHGHGASGLAVVGHRPRMLLVAGLDLVLHHIRELVAVGPEELDAVVLRGVVAGRDHGAGGGPARHRRPRDTSRRHHSEALDVGAGRAQPSGEGSGEEVARCPRVGPENEARPRRAARENRGRGAADPGGQLDGQLLVGDPADAIGPEDPSQWGARLSTAGLTGRPVRRGAGLVGSAPHTPHRFSAWSTAAPFGPS